MTQREQAKVAAKGASHPHYQNLSEPSWNLVRTWSELTHLVRLENLTSTQTLLEADPNHKSIQADKLEAKHYCAAIP